MLDSPLVDIGQFLGMSQCCSEKGKELLASGLKDDGNEGDHNLRCEGALSGTGRAHISEEGVLPESAVHGVALDSRPVVLLSERVVHEVGSSGAAGEKSVGVCFDFEEVRRIYFTVILCIVHLYPISSSFY